MFTGPVQLSLQDIRETSSTRNGVNLGSVGVTRDGRVFRWAKDDGTGILRARLAVNSNQDTDDNNNLVNAVAAIGDLSVDLAVDAAITTDKYLDGYLTTRDGDGEGWSYLVAGNTSTAAAGVTTVSLAEPIQIALAVTSEATLRKHAYDAVQISVTDQLDMPIGVTSVGISALTGGTYFWAQTYGECSVLGDNTTHARGSKITTSAATAGAVGLYDGVAEPLVGVYNEVAVSAEHESVYLTIG